MKRVIITGITGQDGAYLTDFLLEKGYSVIGLLRKDRETNLRNIEYLGLGGKIKLLKADLLNFSDIVEILEHYNIDEFYNLAAQSSVASSFKQPLETINFNIISTAGILEAIRIVNPKIKYYQASSSEMYGNVKKENLPINEKFPLNPISPYGVSKAASHLLTINYRRSYNIFAVCGICFNHESVLRSNNFVTKKIINTAVKISMGLAKELKLGNLNVFRDWGYAPKYVEAMWLMLQQNKAENFIVSSGKAYSLEEFTQKVFKRLNLNFNKFVKIDKTLFRPYDLEVNYGDNSKVKKKLKWEYNISFDELIKLLVGEEIKYIRWNIKNNNDF